MKKTLLALLLLSSATTFAQTSPSKQALVDKLLELQRPGIEQSAQALALRPALQMEQLVKVALQTRVPPDKRDAVAKAVEADLKKYADEVVPLMRQRAVKLAPATVGLLLAEKFSEDELRQLIAIIESPVNRKFHQLGGELQKSGRQAGAGHGPHGRPQGQGAGCGRRPTPGLAQASGPAFSQARKRRRVRTKTVVGLTGSPMCYTKLTSV